MADQAQQLIQDVPVQIENDMAAGMSFFINFMAASSDAVPHHWSRGRDNWLRSFWVKTDPIKTAVSTFVDKAIAVPLTIHPHDRGIKRHVTQARDLEYNLLVQSGVMAGWEHEFSKFLVDYLTQDNGAHMVVMGDGPADGPIVGPCTGVFTLDSGRCTRTGNPQYPVIYDDTDGKRYKMHYSRLISAVKLPSPRADLFGVGHCPVSCCIDAAVELKDIAVMSQEKMGSRPARRVLYAEEGATIENMRGAIEHFETKLDNEGLTRFAKTLLMAPKTAGHRLKLNVLDIIGPHEGFDRMDVTIIDLALIANSFGLDLMDLAAVYGIAGTGKGNQEVVDRKGRGKGVNTLLTYVEKQLAAKALPIHLFAQFDNMDDAQDEHQAGVRDTRSMARERDLRNAVTTPRVERQMMLRRAEITADEFDDLELNDGRLPDGTDLMLLFESQDPDYIAFLTLPGMEDPTDVQAHDPTSAIKTIRDQVKAVWHVIDTIRAAEVSRKARRALGALMRLLSQYEGAKEQKELEARQAKIDAQRTAPDNEEGEVPPRRGGVSSEQTLEDRDIGENAVKTAVIPILSINGVDKH